MCKDIKSYIDSEISILIILKKYHYNNTSLQLYKYVCNKVSSNLKTIDHLVDTTKPSLLHHFNIYIDASATICMHTRY